MANERYREIECLSQLPKPVGGLVRHCAFQRIDFSQAREYALGTRFEDCCFLGCVLPDGMRERLDSGCIVLDRLNMVFPAFISTLYTGESLYQGYDPDRPESRSDCFDTRVYEHYISEGKDSWDIRETLARSIHDHSISDALSDFMEGVDRDDTVAVMGGHALRRDEPAFKDIVMISKSLTEQGKLMVSGGGPGAMEATHLGAWMASRSIREVDTAVQMLSQAPTFQEDGWLQTAFIVRRRFPNMGYRSLSIPTWLYGHEPSTPFASHIAKFFQNSIREEYLLKLSMGGVIYAPGSAGTLREAFQDVEQNHYLTNGHPTPMVFLGREFYSEKLPLYPFLKGMSEKGRMKNLHLTITDDCAEAVRTIMEFRA